MTTQKGRSLVVCVAAIIALAATAACGPDNTSASDAGAATETSASSSAPSAAPETSAPPTTPPAATTAPTTTSSTPSSKATESETPVVTAAPGQVILNPEPEVDGDPGGEAWSEVGVGSLTGDAKCNPSRKMIELELNGTVTVRGSEIKVVKTTNGLVITTSSVLLATALIVNDDAAAKITSTWWNPSGNLSKRSILLPGATWEPVIAGGEFRTLKVCSVKE